MNALNFAYLFNEHAYLSESLASIRQRIARLEEVIENKATIAKAQGRKAKTPPKPRKALRQCKQDEHTLIWTLTECVNKIEGLKRHQLAVEHTMASSWSVPQQEQWAGQSSSPTGRRWTAGSYTGALPSIPTTAPLAQIAGQNHFTATQLLAFPYTAPGGQSWALLNAMVAQAPYELTLPVYAAPPVYGTLLSSPALNPTAPEFKHDDARSDGMVSLSLSVAADPVLTGASAAVANKETNQLLDPNESGTTEYDSQVITALRSMDATQPRFHRNNKPAPLVHPSIMRMRGSAMRSPEELISPKTIPQHRRRYSEETIERIESRLKHSLSSGVKSPRKVNFTESSFNGFEYVGPEPDTPMKGHKRGAKSELSRPMKRVDEDMWDQSSSGQPFGTIGTSGDGTPKMADTAPGEEFTDDEGEYVGYGIVWNWEDGGAVWPKTPLAVRVRQYA